MEIRRRSRLRPPRGTYGERPSRLRRRLIAYRMARHARPRTLPPRIAVPSFFTLLNLFAGFLAIIQVSEGRLTYAAWLIVLAGFFDMLDGMMARLTGSASQFGIELDSLADVVSFGVAPAFMIFEHGLREFGALGILVAALPALCGAVRLARFNTFAESEKRDHFEGLPIPAQAAALVSYLLTFQDVTWFESFAGGELSVVIPLVIVLSTLMVTNVRFDAIPQPSRSYIRTHRFQTIAFSGSVLLVIFLQELGLFISLLGYITHGLGRAILGTARSLWEDELPASQS